MEALLQRILPLMPKEIDVANHTSAIKSFVDGSEDTLPEEVSFTKGNISKAKIPKL